jgi:hypothetical protein
MNLADYLSELLGQHDEVSVPGLGCFIRERIKGYYNDKEDKFYPPHHRVKFVPKPKDDDDTFTQYVADKKNISLASSKYFAEKFISKLHEDAARGKYTFADLGSFQTEQDQLVFKPYDKISSDPAFYGYIPVSIKKTGQIPSNTHLNPVFAQSALSSGANEQPLTQPEYFEEETETKRPVNIWLILIIAIAAIALALFGVYKFYPVVFDNLGTAYHKAVGKKDSTDAPVLRHEVTTDTIKKETSVKDTVKQKVAAAAADTNVADTVKHSRFEVIDNSYRRLPMANASLRRLKAKGIVAPKILTDAPGPLLKVSVGTFPTYGEAQTAMKKMIREGKINKNSQILPIQ